jgi:glyoxylase-like metal-dependent hydrolase (beta-lactamase superfamily II)
MSDRSIATSIALIALIASSMLAACSPRSETPQTSASPSTSAPASESEDVKEFAIGGFAGMALRDGGIALPNDNKIFGVGRTRAEVAALLASAGLPTDELHLTIQPLLVKTADRILLFDTGAGKNMGTGGGKLAASMAAAGIDPGAVTDVFISHVHGDHVGGLLNGQGAPAFPNAAIHISAPEWKFLAGMTAETAASVVIAQHPALVAAMAPKVAEFTPGADIIPGVVKAVEIRGHTPGHSGYLIASGNDSLLYVGDAMHHFVVSVQKPDWTIQFDADAPTAEASRSDLLARSAASGQRIYAVHFPFPGLGKVERRADGFVWVAE